MKAPKKTQRKHFSWSSTAKEENAETVLTSFFQDLYSTPANLLDSPKRRGTHWIELKKNLRVDCAGRTLISTEKLEKVLSKLEYGSGSLDQLTSDVLKALPPGCLGNLAKSLVSDVLRHELRCQVQADRCFVCDAENLGDKHRMRPRLHPEFLCHFLFHRC